ERGSNEVEGPLLHPCRRTERRPAEVEQRDAADVVNGGPLGDPAQFEESRNDVDLRGRPLAGAKDGREILVVGIAECDEHSTHRMLVNDVIEFRALTEEGEDA